MTATWQLQPATVVQVARVLPVAARAGGIRPDLAGVLLDGHRVVATDAYRMAVADVPDALPRLLLPARELGWAVRGARGGGLDLAVYDGGSRLSCPATGKAWHLAARPSDRYPDPAQVLALAAAAEDVIEAELAELRTRVAELAGDRRRGRVVLALAPAAGRLRLHRPDTGTDAVVAAQCTPARPVGVDAGFLLDALTGLDGPRVRLEVGGGLRPLRLAEDGIVHVVLPCRLPPARAPEAAA